jgi:hypothetical protein
MIDAYTIGITLALEDGVSDGIATIRRDLAGLDAAVAESTARLLTLRKLAADLAIPMAQAGPPQGTAVFAPPIYRPAPMSLTVTAEQQSAEPAAVAMPAPVAPPQAAEAVRTPEVPPGAQSAARPEPPIEVSPATPPAAGRAVSKPAPTAPMVTRGPAVRDVPLVERPVPASVSPMMKPMVPPQVPPAAPQTNGGQSPDYAAIARLLAPRMPAAPPAVPPDIDRAVLEPHARELPSTQTISAPKAMPSHQRLPLVASRVVPKVASPASAPSPRQPTIAPIVPVPVPPPQQPTGRLSYAAVPSQSSLTAAASAALWPSAPIAQPQSPRASTPARSDEARKPSTPTGAADPAPVDSPPHAELHLDGAVLGRWVTRHLERQVTRPQAGATGFDPRMTPSWAGAPIGN